MDQFLFAHKRTGVPLFDLSINLNTISVRDQMTRALLLAERLPAWLQSQLGLNYVQRTVQYPILVVGGGACGMTAAVALAQRGLTVEVAEKDGHLFNLQRNCTSRWIDPTQYDWPLDTWQVQRFPQRRNHRRAPFRWGPNTARKIAQGWGGQLSHNLRHGLANRLSFRQPTEAALNPLYNQQLRGSDKTSWASCFPIDFGGFVRTSKGDSGAVQRSANTSFQRLRGLQRDHLGVRTRGREVQPAE